MHKVLKYVLTPILLVLSPTLYAWQDYPPFQDLVSKSTVVLTQITDEGSLHEFCSGSHVRDKDGLFIYTAAHCCDITDPTPIYAEDIDGMLHPLERITIKSLDTDGYDICRITPSNPLPIPSIKQGKPLQIYRDVDGVKREDIRMYISSHFPRYCSINPFERGIPIASDWCFQRAYMLTRYDNDPSRIMFVSTKGSGPGMSGSPILNIQGDLIGILSTGYRTPELGNIGGFAPIWESSFYENKSE